MLTRVVLYLVLATHVVILATCAWVRSPVYDEPAHLAAGVSQWVHGRFDLFCANPPLTRMIGAIPVALLDSDPAWLWYSAKPQDRYEFLAGERLLAHYGENSLWLFTLGRWLCIPISLFGGLICFQWAKELYGEPAGLCALSLWCFSPNILTHAAHITPDASAASFGIAAAYMFWKWLQRLTFRSAFVAGIVLGLAELTKMTWIILFFLWPIVWLVGLAIHRRWPKRGELAQLLVVLTMGLYVLNLGYSFRGTGQNLGDYNFRSQALTGHVHSAMGNRFSDSILGKLPVPLPTDYVNGIDIVKEAFEMKRIAYLGGSFNNGGWWYYYFYALAVKTPVGTLILLALALFAWRGRPLVKSGFDAELLLLLIPAVLLISSSVNSGINRHVRYVLPILPFLFIFSSRVAQPTFIALSHGTKRCVAFIPIAAFAWAIISSLLVFPHFTAYFNEPSGGPANGPNHLISSNIDWGQDLLNLRSWIQDHPKVTNYSLAYYGPTDPALVGIISTGLPPRFDPTRQEFSQELHAGWHIVSVTLLRGQPARTYSNDGTKVYVDFHSFGYFLPLEPVARVGYSIYVYHLTEDDVRHIYRNVETRTAKT